MYYLFFQIWVWLVIAFFFGWLSHWFFCCRNKEEAENIIETNNTTAPLMAAAPITAPEIESAIQQDWKPALFTFPPESTDDLKRVKGIGAVIEKTLNELGVYQFEQIANWNEQNCEWVDNFLSFPGRISRESWVEQAKLLASGETTEFAKRVDKGDVDYNA